MGLNPLWMLPSEFVGAKLRVFMTWEYCFFTLFHKIDFRSTNYSKQKVNTLRNEVIRKLQT